MPPPAPPPTHTHTYMNIVKVVAPTAKIFLAVAGVPTVIAPGLNTYIYMREHTTYYDIPRYDVQVCMYIIIYIHTHTHTHTHTNTHTYRYTTYRYA
jgi:hypothetical protein